MSFYIVEQALPDSIFQTAAKLIDKAYRQKLKTWVICGDEATAEKLDDWLWTFDETSFLPHALASELPVDEQPPIQIGLSLPSSEQDFNILLNLSEQMPEAYTQFQRVLEVVPANKKEAARIRYKTYRDNECDLHRHVV